MPIFGKLTGFEPRPRVRAIGWLRDHGRTMDGQPFDPLAFPHVCAPGGACDMLDDDEVREISLMWASRLGKTAFGLWGLEFLSAVRPAPGMFASSDEKTALEVTKRQYQMLERCGPLKDHLLPERMRKNDLISLRDSVIYVAWSRSVSTLADKAVRWGHANEVDKWVHQGAGNKTAKEAHPLKLFDNRFKEFPTHKKIKESTPTIKGHSAIERLVLASTNCRLYVPCPHCRFFQVLEFERIRWEKLASGKHCKDLARRTAYYECCSCNKQIRDEHRPTMMRAGVWVPEGCQVNQKGAKKLMKVGGDGAALQDHLVDRYQWRGWKHASWITGKPHSDGRDAGYQLSSLYALSLGWGDIASEFVAAKDDPQSLRDFINSWLGKTWEQRSSRQTWQQLGERIIAPNIPRGIAPPWASLVTIGVDRQQDVFRYGVLAWGPERRGHLVAAGDVGAIGELGPLVETAWPHLGGGPPLKAVLSLIDSGFKPEGIYEFCLKMIRRRLQVWPCKGSSTALNAAYRISTLTKDTSCPGMRLFWIDTLTTQGWIERQLAAEADEASGLTLHSGSLVEHQDLLEQLLNDGAILKLDSANNSREVWERLDESVPNDFRDCVRYAYAAMLAATRGAKILPRGQAPTAESQPAAPRLTTPDGRPFLITER